MPPIIAIVGPPNAGKSTLFNKIIGLQKAVTSGLAGTTRDRQYASTHWNGQELILVDTAGLGFFSNQTELETQVRAQIDIATQEADLLLLVVDGKGGPAALDRKTLTAFRKAGKPAILAVNKLDSPQNTESKLVPFYRLGLKQVYGISSLTGRGIGDLLDGLVSILPRIKSQPTTYNLQPTTSIAVAIVGKPNVGKSSIFNRILGQERVVVSSTPGTTRTAIDSHLEMDGQTYTFIDTAGLKKKAHRQAVPDLYAAFQTYKSIRRSDVAMLVIDAAQPLTSQDLAIAGEIFEQNKGCIILANKTDLYLKKIGLSQPQKITAKTKKENLRSALTRLQAYLSDQFPFLWMCPVFFVSAMTGEGLAESLTAIKPIYDRRHQTVPQEQLNQLLAQVLQTNPPKRLKDQKLPKVLGLKQIATNPPLFEVYVNHPPAVSESFRKYLAKTIIKDLDFWGTQVSVHKVKQVGKIEKG